MMEDMESLLDLPMLMNFSLSSEHPILSKIKLRKEFFEGTPSWISNKSREIYSRILKWRLHYEEPVHFHGLNYPRIETLLNFNALTQYLEEID